MMFSCNDFYSPTEDRGEARHVFEMPYFLSKQNHIYPSSSQSMGLLTTWRGQIIATSHDLGPQKR